LTVYGIYYNGKLRDLYETKQKAVAGLKVISDNIRPKYAIKILKDDEDFFEYLLNGWPEADCIYHIREVEVK
jgi:hypothetical protein